LQQRRHRGGRRETDEDFQRAIERQAGVQQRGELAGNREQLVARHRLRFEPAPALTIPGGCGAGGRNPAAGRVRDLHRHQSLVAQAVDDLVLVRGVELADGDFAGRVHGTVAVNRHLRSSPRA
jgi:hypothetical protein